MTARRKRSPEQYEKRRRTMVRKAGGVEAYLEQQRSLARKGGKNQGKHNNPSNFANNKGVARRANKIRHAALDQPAAVLRKQLKAERHPNEEIAHNDPNFKMGREIAEAQKESHESQAQDK